jgi:predicted kinase
MNVKLIICRGVPASGKSTYSKQWVLEDSKKRVRVNRDDIRRMLGKYWVPSREKLVSAYEETIIHHSLSMGYSVIIDATNMKSKKDHLSIWKQRTKWNMNQNIVDIEFKDFFDVPLEECIRRDSERTEMKVGEDVIKRFYDKQLKLKDNE